MNYASQILNAFEYTAVAERGQPHIRGSWQRLGGKPENREKLPLRAR